MSDTPRTDEATIPWNTKACELDDKVPVSFARQLERELNETNRLLMIADEDCDALRDYVWFLEREAGETLTQRAKEAFNNRTKQ